jgi:hypothetical protein
MVGNHVPAHVLHLDSRWWSGFGSKASTHSYKGHADKQVIGEGYAIGAKYLVLGVVITIAGPIKRVQELIEPRADRKKDLALE